MAFYTHIYFCNVFYARKVSVISSSIWKNSNQISKTINNFNVISRWKINSWASIHLNWKLKNPNSNRKNVIIFNSDCEFHYLTISESWKSLIDWFDCWRGTKSHLVPFNLGLSIPDHLVPLQILVCYWPGGLFLLMD